MFARRLRAAFQAVLLLLLPFAANAEEPSFQDLLDEYHAAHSQIAQELEAEEPGFALESAENAEDLATEILERADQGELAGGVTGKARKKLRRFTKKLWKQTRKGEKAIRRFLKNPKKANRLKRAKKQLARVPVVLDRYFVPTWGKMRWGTNARWAAQSTGKGPGK